MKKILFIPEYNSYSGWGHLVRCINLSEIFIQNKWKIFFYIPNKIKINLNIEKINIISKLDRNFFNLIFLDKYKINQKYVDNLKKKCDKICIIDDFGKIKLKTDFYLNYTNDNSFSKSDLSTTKLLGLNYLIQRSHKKNNLNFFKRKNLEKEIKITIFYSSISNKKIIFETLDNLKLNKYYSRFKINVILTSQIKISKRELEALKNEQDCNTIINEKNMNYHYENCHLFIGSYGYSFIERIFSPCVSICLVQFDNQIQNYNFFKQKKLSMNIKNINRINSTIYKIIEKPNVLNNINKNKKKYLKINSNQNIYNKLVKNINY